MQPQPTGAAPHCDRPTAASSGLPLADTASGKPPQALGDCPARLPGASPQAFVRVPTAGNHHRHLSGSLLLEITTGICQGPLLLEITTGICQGPYCWKSPQAFVRVPTVGNHHRHLSGSLLLEITTGVCQYPIAQRERWRERRGERERRERRGERESGEEKGKERERGERGGTEREREGRGGGDRQIESGSRGGGGGGGGEEKEKGEGETNRQTDRQTDRQTQRDKVRDRERARRKVAHPLPPASA